MSDRRSERWERVWRGHDRSVARFNGSDIHFSDSRDYRSFVREESKLLTDVLAAGVKRPYVRHRMWHG
jgi:hypothetical protein